MNLDFRELSISQQNINDNLKLTTDALSGTIYIMSHVTGISCFLSPTLGIGFSREKIKRGREEGGKERRKETE